MAGPVDRYGLLVIGGAVGIVLLVAIIVGYRAFQQSQNEAASLRYEALLQQIGEEEAGAQFEALSSFAREETNGYGVLAAIGAARALLKMAISPPHWRDLTPWLHAAIWRARCAIMHASRPLLFW